VNSTWVRPYAAGRGRWLIVAWELGGLAFVDWTSVRLFNLGTPAVAGLTAALAVLWLIGSWRIARMGVYVSEYGVRSRGIVGSRTLRWTQIERITLDEAVYRIGGLRVPGGTTVVIRCHDGTWVNTSLWVQGIDFHSRPALFREVYHGLREAHSAALA
jgi:Bacterial PH domain